MGPNAELAVQVLVNLVCLGREQAKVCGSAWTDAGTTKDRR